MARARGSARERRAARARSLARRYVTVGGWDEDAAEHIAYDATTQRVFVASAEAASVSVVSIADPTAPTIVDTLDISTALATAKEREEAVGAAAQNLSWFISWVLHSPYAFDKCMQLLHWHRHVVESSALISSLCVPKKNLLQSETVR